LNLAFPYGRLEPPEVRGPDRLDQRLDDDRQPERDQQGVEGADLEAREKPLHRDAEREESRNNHYERQQRIDASDRRELIAEIGCEKREREVREVDLAQEAPRQGEAEAQQPVKGADEDPGQHRLRDERKAGKPHRASGRERDS
jgi:hypothetical protein